MAHSNAMPATQSRRHRCYTCCCGRMDREAPSRCQTTPRHRHRQGEQNGWLVNNYISIAEPTYRSNLRVRGRIKRGFPMHILLFIAVSILSLALGWSPPQSATHHMYKFSSPRPTRIKGRSLQYSTQLWTSNSRSSQSSIDTKQSSGTKAEPAIIEEVIQQINRLTKCLQLEHANENGIISSQPIYILKSILSIYANWCSKDNPSPQLRFKASATIDQAFRLVTNEAFAAPYQLSWVNLGMEALQLQLHSAEFNDNLGVNGNLDSSIKLIPLQRPYDAIPKGTWLKALRALTSQDINSVRSISSTRSIKSLSGQDTPLQWSTPSNAAFRILQRLVSGRGIRTFKKKKLQSSQIPKQQSLDERDFNMVLHAYARYPQNQYIHAAHRVMALQERTVHAPPLSPVAYSILLKAYGQEKDNKNVEMSIRHAQRNGIVPDIVMANTVLDAYVNCGMLDKAEDLFRGMTIGMEEEEGFWPLLRPNSRTYNTLLKGMAEEGDIRSAMKLSGVVDSKGLWDAVTTNTLIKAAVTAAEFDLAEDILSNHTISFTREGQDHPNVEAYTELLDGYAKDGQLENALRVMQLMQSRGVTPNEYTFTCIVGALARNNKVRQALKMIHYAADNLLLVSLTPTYNAFISGLLSDNRNANTDTAGVASHAANMVEVLSVLQQMQELNIHPNVVTVALVVDGLGKCNPPRCKEAREMVQHLEYITRTRQSSGSYYNQQVDEDNKGKGISLSNNKIATALITAYGRENDIDSAMEAFNRIASPDVVAFNSLLDTCCRCDQIKLAFVLFNKYVSYEQATRQEAKAPSIGADKQQQLILITPDVVTYTTLISALLQLKSRAATRRANILYEEMKREWWISPDTILIDTIITAMISGGPFGFIEEDVQFTLSVLRDGSKLEWEKGQYEKRRKAVRGILVGCSSEVWKNDEFAFGLVNEEEDVLFRKKGWNKIDSGFRLWGGGDDAMKQNEPGDNSVDSFLASKGWNDIDSGFRLV